MTRIGISGSGGSGKSTLAIFLASALRLPLVGEGVRPWLRERGLTNPWTLAAGEQLELQRHAIRHKIDHERDRSAFVSDRTTVDAASLLTLRMELASHPIPGDLLDEALAHARATYDVAVVLGPWRLSPEPDMVGPELRQRESALTLRFYQSLGTRIIQVPLMAAADIAPFVLRALGVGVTP